MCHLTTATILFLLFLSLFLFSREDLREIEVISQTDLKCVWSTQKNVTKQKYEAVPVNEMPCLKDKITNCNVPADDDKLFNFFVNKLPSAAITKHL